MSRPATPARPREVAPWPRGARLDGLLVAGGRSRRFGGDKRFARFGRATLAELALSVLRAHCGSGLFVAGRGAFAHPVRAVFVADAAAGVGPLGAIVAALRRARFGVLVLPCDAPFVRSDTVAAIARAALRGGRAVVARSPRGLEPLLAFYPRAALPFLEASLKARRVALHRLLARLDAVEIAVRDGRELHNVNRPADLEEALLLRRPRRG
jgi:molybdopterin-guanine dinucleotide biosynthesis protein A